MEEKLRMKYPREYFLEFQSSDRFLYRASDLYSLTDNIPPDLMARVNGCNVYLLVKRPRLSIMPESIIKMHDRIGFSVIYKIEGKSFDCKVGIPNDLFGEDEVIFEASPYPHRELVVKDVDGKLKGTLLLANLAQLIINLPPEARDLEVVYVGKGLANSAQDRLGSHSTLQRVLAEINSNEPDNEVFILVYMFNSRKFALNRVVEDIEITGEYALKHDKLAFNYKPTLEERIALIEASIIAYFKTEKYNTQCLDFPKKGQKILRKVHQADFAGMIIQLDNTNIAEQKVFSKKIQPESTHYIVVDFRKLEGRSSLIDGMRRDQYSQERAE